jgi:hypothetical protein
MSEFVGKVGRHLLELSSSRFDPERTSARPSQIAVIQTQPPISLKNKLVFNWQVRGGRYFCRYLPCVAYMAWAEPLLDGIPVC